VDTTRTDKELDAMLEAAIIANWHELFRSSVAPVCVHVEYQEHYGEALEYFKVWVTSGKGHWDLVCEWCPLAAGVGNDCVGFSNGYHSAGLRLSLEPAIRRFAISAPDILVGGVVQVYPPTERELAAALAWLGGLQPQLEEQEQNAAETPESPLAIAS
jgi:hypothetical protein